MEKMIDSLLNGRFGHDSLLALATEENGVPSVRAVNAIYMNGAFYCVTYLLSAKMRQIAGNSTVGLCGEWFTAHARAESLGWIRLEENEKTAERLRAEFASWYQNGHVDEADENTIILKMVLTDGVIMAGGKRYEF